MCLPVLAAITRVLINVTLVNPDSVCLKCIHLRKMEGTGKVAFLFMYFFGQLNNMILTGERRTVESEDYVFLTAKFWW